MPAYKQKDKNTWYVKFRYKDWTGQTKWVTKRGFATKREALQWETEFNLKNSGSVDMTFADFAKVYEENMRPRLREGTRARKENTLQKQILPYLGKKRLRDITSTDILQWQNALLSHVDARTGKPYSKSYLRSVHAELSAMFNHAVKFYGLKENPARLAGAMGNKKDIEMAFWTQGEYQLFAEAMMDDPLAYYCFEMLYWCGIREGELLALTREDVDLDAKTVSITKTFQHVKGKDIIGDPKTLKSKRTVLMPDFLCDEIADYLEMCYDLQPTDRLFPVTKHFLYRKIKKGADLCGIKRIRVHDLRHSHVSLLIDMGFSAVAIADRLGHESIDITYRYAHLFPSVQNQMVDSLNAFRKEKEDVPQES